MWENPSLEVFLKNILMAATLTACQLACKLDLLQLWHVPLHAWHTGLLHVLVTHKFLDAMAPWKSVVNMLLRGRVVQGEWRLYPVTVKMIWSHFGLVKVDLFHQWRKTHCSLFFSLTEMSGDESAGVVERAR